MIDRLFTLVYLGGIVTEIILRLPYDRQRRQIPKTDQRVSQTERSLLAVLFTGMLFLPLVFGLTRWLNFADYRWSPAAKVRAGSLGSLLLAAALWLFWRSHRDLGSNWSPSLEIGAQQTLITRGVYRSIRHPMYASQFIWMLAQPLLLQNWIAGALGALAFLPMYLIRVPREEQMMLDHFGDEYREYVARTGRIVPRLRGSRQHDRNDGEQSRTV